MIHEKSLLAVSVVVFSTESDEFVLPAFGVTVFVIVAAAAAAAVVAVVVAADDADPSLV